MFRDINSVFIIQFYLSAVSIGFQSCILDSSLDSFRKVGGTRGKVRDNKTNTSNSSSSSVGKGTREKGKRLKKSLDPAKFRIELGLIPCPQ